MGTIQASQLARIQNYNTTFKHKDRTCKEIVAELPLSQSTVSKHLRDPIRRNFICRKKLAEHSRLYLRVE
jgi:DNA-binding MarR family transcriptional regulator